MPEYLPPILPDFDVAALPENFAFAFISTFVILYVFRFRYYDPEIGS
jgi:hypothetical protein